ncbi:MAG: pyruvate carboxylase subunit B, partial [Candidatus Hodarchaeota archaeon]
EDMLPIVEKIDQVGYHSLEVWGGATFDSALRYLKESPWERLRLIREHIPHTKLQMLLRGQNIVGYKHYPDDVLEQFIVNAVSCGLDIFRIFDALNDTRNMEFAIKIVAREDAHVQAAICYTTSPVHNIDKFVKDAKTLEELGADSICIKDMAGLIDPTTTYELVRRLKEELDKKTLVQLHSHYTSGMASMAYLKAVEAGVDVVDTAISSLAMLTSQPPCEPLVATLQETERDTGLDLTLLSEISQYFRNVRVKYQAFESGLVGVDTNVLLYQIPGGMYSNLISQLKDQNALDKLPEVLQEVPKVRHELGWCPLVTPTSQLVGAQAVLNVLTRERWKIIPKEVIQYIRGYYGRAPAPIDEAIKQKAIGDDEPISVRPADLLPPLLDDARNAIKQYSEKEEDAISYALFPEVTLEWLKEKTMPKKVNLTKIAAISATVIRQLQQKRVPPLIVPVARPSIRYLNIWGLAGRQELHKGMLDQK